MRRLIITLLAALLTINASAQVQKGIVRTQSFFTKQSKPLNDVRIILYEPGMGTKSGPISNMPPGEFELTLDAFPSPKIFRLKSVELRRYHLLDRNLLDRKLEYTPHSPLVIIMQNDDELAEYQDRVEKKAKAGLTREFEKKIKVIEFKYQNDIEERDRQIAQLKSWKIKNEKIIDEFIEGKLRNTDFEIQNELAKAVSAALEEGDFEKVDSLNNSKGGLFNELELFKKEKEEHERLREQDNIKGANYIERLTSEFISCIGRNMPDSAYKCLIVRSHLDPDRVDFVLDIGSFLEEYRSEYKQALQHYERALEMAKRLYEPDAEIIARCLQRKGDVLCSLGRYSESLPLLEQAREILERQGEASNSYLYDALLSLGQLHSNIGKFKLAEEFFSKCSSKNNRNNQKAAQRAKLGLAVIQCKKGMYKEGRQQLVQLVNNIKDTAGDNFLIKAETYQGLVQCLYQEGLIREAMDTLQTAIHYITKIGGDKHVSLVNLLVTESQILLDQGLGKQAEDNMNKALDIIKNTIGEDNNTYNDILSFIANFYNQTGEPGKAHALAQQALEKTAGLYGRQHILTIPARLALENSYINITEIKAAKAQLDTIKAIYQKTELHNTMDNIFLEINRWWLKASNSQKEKEDLLRVLELAEKKYTEDLGPQAIGLKYIYSSLASLYINDGNLPKASETLKKKRQLTEKIHGKESLASSACGIQEAKLLVLECNFDRAFDLLQKAEQWGERIYGGNSFYMTDIYNAIGDYHCATYYFDKALEYYTRALSIIEKTFGEGNAKTMESIKNLSSYYYDTGEFNKAENYALKALEIIEKNFGKDSPLVLSTMYQMALISLAKKEGLKTDSLLTTIKKISDKYPDYSEDHRLDYIQLLSNRLIQKGEYQEAEQLGQEMMNINEKKYHGNKNIMFQSLSLLSKIHTHIGRYDLAKKEVERNLDISREVYGAKSRQTISAILACINFYIATYDIKNAWNLYHEGVRIMEKSLGAKHIFNIHFKKAKAQLLHVEGKYDQALSIFKEVISDTKKIHGENKMEIAMIVKDMASVYSAMGMTDSAIVCFNEALDAYEAYLGKDSPALVDLLITMGQAYLSNSFNSTSPNITEARNCFRHAMIICKKFLTDTPTAYQVQMHLDQISMIQATDLNSYNKAFNLWKKSLQHYYDAAYKDTYHPESNMFVILANNMMANMLMSVNQPQDAIGYFDKALSINNNIFGENHVSSATFIQGRGNAEWALANLLSLNNLTNKSDSMRVKAIESYRLAADLILNHYGELTPNVLPAYTMLIKVYEALHDYEKVAEMLDKSLAIYKNSYTGPKNQPDPRAFDCRMAYVNLYQTMGDSIKALEAVSLLLEDAQKILDKGHTKLSFYQIIKAELLIALHKDTDLAIQLLDEVWDGQERFHHTISETGFLVKFYMGIALTYKCNYKNAIKCFEEARSIIFKITNLTNRQFWLDQISRLITYAQTCLQSKSD